MRGKSVEFVRFTFVHFGDEVIAYACHRGDAFASRRETIKESDAFYQSVACNGAGKRHENPREDSFESVDSQVPSCA